MVLSALVPCAFLLQTLIGIYIYIYIYTYTARYVRNCTGRNLELGNSVMQLLNCGN